MIKLEKPSNLVSVNFRLAPSQVHQLVMLGLIHGNRTRALVVALDRLYQDELRNNPAFAELVAEGQDPPDAPDAQPVHPARPNHVSTSSAHRATISGPPSG